ncbi:putative reverse transcriptase domain-containing protein [Tanacetum coccineum]
MIGLRREITLSDPYSAATHFRGVTDWYQSLVMSSASSAVTYTSDYVDYPCSGRPVHKYVPGPEHPPSPDYVSGPEHPPSPVYLPYVPEPEYPKYLAPSDDEAPTEDQPLPDDASVALSPGYVPDSDPEEDPEEDSEEEHADYPADGGDGDDEPSDDDTDDDDADDDEEPFEDEDEDEEEEEHLAPADSSAIPMVDPVPSAGDTEAFETDESAPTPRAPQIRIPFAQTRLRRARKTVRPEPPMSASMEARIAEHAAAPTPPLPIASLPLPLPSPLTTSPTDTGAPLGYRAAGIRMRAADASPPLPLPPTSPRTDIPEADMPPRKRACLTTPAPGYEIGESSAAGAARQPGSTPAVDTWDEIVEAMMEIAPTTLEGVDQRVTELDTTVRQRTEEFEVRFEEAHDDRAYLGALVNTLYRERIQHRRTALAIDREAIYARIAWTSSEERSAAIEAHVRTLEAQVATLIAQTTSLQTQLTTALGRIATLEARDPEPHQRAKRRRAAGCVADALAERDASRSIDGDDSHGLGTGQRRQVPTQRECTYTDFLKCHPMNFKGTKGVVGSALTWWNSHVRAVRQDVAYAMPWTTLKRMITDKYYPRGEIKRLEFEYWNLKVRGTDLLTYNQRFQELALMCDRMFPEESAKVERYVGGLPDIIHGSVKASKPQSMQEVIEFATEMMDKKMLTVAERQAENKRKFEDTSKNTTKPHSRSKGIMWHGLTMLGLQDKKPYGGTKPLCTSNNNNNQRAQGPNPRGITCFECGVQGHFRSDCPKLKNGNQGNRAGNGNAVARAYDVGSVGTNPNSNIVTVTLSDPDSVATHFRGVTTMLASYLCIKDQGIPLVNVSELLEIDPYEEVAQQGQAHPLSPAYVPDPMELDEHVPVYVLEPEHPEFHAPLADDIRVKDQPYADDASPTAESPGYIVDSDSMEEDTDEDPSKEHKPEDDDDDDDTNDEDEEPTEDEEEEEHLAPANSFVVPVVDPVPSARDTEAFETDESAPTPRLPHTRGMISPPPINLTYDQAPLGHRAAMIRMKDDIPKEDMPPRGRFVLTAPLPSCDIAESSTATARASRGQYDFVDTIGTRQGLVRSPGHEARTIARAADRAEDVGYARALQASEHRMMTSIEEVNLRVSYQVQARKRESEDFYTQLLDAQTDRRDIRLEIDVVRGQRTAYETELQEVRQAYLRSEAQNRALLARLETLETHMTRMEWQRQRAEDDAVRQIMRTHVLEARARIDTVEDTGSSFIISICIDIVIISHVHCVLVIIRIMPITRQGTNDAMTPESIQAMIDRAIQRNSTQDDDSQNSGGGIRRPVQPARVCTYPDFMKCQPLNFKGTEGVVGLNQWLKKMESVFHISGCAVENQVKFATCHDDAYAMTWGTFKKKLSDKYCPNGEIKKLEIDLWNLKIDKYIGGLPDNIHRNCMSTRPKTLDFAIELANDLMDQKLRTYAERQNENKRKVDDSSRNNHQQQSHKRQNVARAYTVGPGEKKVYTRDLTLCTKCNYHHTGQCAPKCVKCKRYGHATTDCRVNTNNNNSNNNNKNQKAGACYECGNTGHIKKNCPKLKNHWEWQWG